ncbi:hypothetical protein M885DRAFT_501757 [Pelagophyceae sp. CCMP2097]|nr:hypothetical protein M885DRAFT_501757 [Pelagophyceae sp. CCMP2097]
MRRGRPAKSLLLLGLAALAGLLTALVVGLVFGVRTERHHERQRQRQKCASHRDVITEWAKKQAARVYGLGLQMDTAKARPLPFLLPDAETYGIFYDTMSYTTKLYGGNSFATPSVAWCPTVSHADRETYEVVMSNALGYDFNITQVRYGGGQGQKWSESAPAPESSSYNPAAVAWSVLQDPAADANLIKGLIGTDIQHRGWQMWPDAAKRVFRERRTAVLPFYLGDGEPIADDALVVIVPYCGRSDCDAEGSEVVGIWVLGLVAELWDSLFPDHIGAAGSADAIA